MKGRKEFEIRWKRSGFPRFSQKGAGKSARQVQAGKRFGAVSTDSQASSQQQGFMVLFFRIILLQKNLWLWILQQRRNWKTHSGAASIWPKHISTVPRAGRALYFSKKRVEYVPDGSQAAASG